MPCSPPVATIPRTRSSLERLLDDLARAAARRARPTGRRRPVCHLLARDERLEERRCEGRGEPVDSAWNAATRRTPCGAGDRRGTSPRSGGARRRLDHDPGVAAARRNGAYDAVRGVRSGTSTSRSLRTGRAAARPGGRTRRPSPAPRGRARSVSRRRRCGPAAPAPAPRARPGRVRRSDEAVVAATDHHDVVPPLGALLARHRGSRYRAEYRKPSFSLRFQRLPRRLPMPAVTVDDLTVLPRLRDPGSVTAVRPVVAVTDAPAGFEGEGFPVRRAFAGVDLRAPRPVHPHGPDGRGRVRPGRAQGHARGTRTAASRPSPTSSTASSTTRTATVAAASITNGDTQWMTAGSGLLHIETPPEWLVAAGRPVPRHPAVGEPAPRRKVDRPALPGPPLAARSRSPPRPTPARWSG